jgi:transcriptional regulator GlxA family with amidase domain
MENLYQPRHLIGKGKSQQCDSTHRFNVIADQSEQRNPRVPLLGCTWPEKVRQHQEKVKWKVECIEKKRVSTNRDLTSKLAKVQEYIHRNYHKELNNKILADVACLNRFYFLRQFKQAFAVTPHQYLTTMRLLVACYLLANTQWSITKISRSIGFADLASFSKLFKSRFDNCPREFRYAFGSSGIRYHKFDPN